MVFLTPIKIQSAKMVDDGSGGSVLKVEFQNAQVFNANPSDAEPRISDDISIRACIGGSGIDPAYDYSQLGETWSTPKIVRMPSSSGSSQYWNMIDMLRLWVLVCLKEMLVLDQLYL